MLTMFICGAARAFRSAAVAASVASAVYPPLSPANAAPPVPPRSPRDTLSRCRPRVAWRKTSAAQITVSLRQRGSGEAIAQPLRGPSCGGVTRHAARARRKRQARARSPSPPDMPVRRAKQRTPRAYAVAFLYAADAHIHHAPDAACRASRCAARAAAQRKDTEQR